MARIFTTNFEFNKQQYDAIITVLTKDKKVVFKIQVLDDELIKMIPGGQLSYDPKDGFTRSDLAKNNLASSLLRSISHAIEEHLIH
jgi:hypothetical protein